MITQRVFFFFFRFPSRTNCFPNPTTENPAPRTGCYYYDDDDDRPPDRPTDRPTLLHILGRRSRHYSTPTRARLTPSRYAMRPKPPPPRSSSCVTFARPITAVTIIMVRRVNYCLGGGVGDAKTFPRARALSFYTRPARRSRTISRFLPEN